MKLRGTVVFVLGCVLAAPLVLLLGGERESANTRSVATWPTKGWVQASPASVGLDEAVLEGLDKGLASGKYGLVDSFSVFRCGKQVYAKKYKHDYATIYGNQAKVKGPLNARMTGRYNYFDPEWHPYYNGTELHSMQSVSKSVTSVIIGIAKTRGDFKAGVDTPVLKYFDATKVKNVDDRKRRMTIKDVLTMTAGLEWNENVPYDDWRSDASLMEASDDWVQYVIDKPMAAESGKVFNYNSGATELLAHIFKRETGEDIESYGEKYLFQPLGVKYYWKHSYDGVVDAEGGLYLKDSDLAKIGYLFLHDGIWDGNQIVSKEWITTSLNPYIDAGEGYRYGYQWWLYAGKDTKTLVWMCRGFGGQRLMVFPEENLLVVFTGWQILEDEAAERITADTLLNAVKMHTCDSGKN